MREKLGFKDIDSKVVTISTPNPMSEKYKKILTSVTEQMMTHFNADPLWAHGVIHVKDQEQADHLFGAGWIDLPKDKSKNQVIPMEPMEVRCTYCRDCSHLTRECPGLRVETVNVRAFKVAYNKMYPSQALPLGPAPQCAVVPTTTVVASISLPRHCFDCKYPEHSGRKLFDSKRMKSAPEWLCGDCMSRKGIPLSKQPVKEPERINYHAWETPAWDGIG